MSNIKKETDNKDDKTKAEEKKGKTFLERGSKGHDSHNMGNDISGDVKVANSNGDLEGGDDNRWHINEGK
ncbi:MAG: hypothetical protein ABI415_00665 [Flavitalea sp.]